MRIEHVEEKHIFFLYSEQEDKMGEIKYIPAADDELYAVHTEVYTDYEGQGLAAKLLDALVEYARANSKKIVPTCPYVIASFKKYPERYKDVMKRTQKISS